MSCCGKTIEVDVPKGYHFVTIEVKCGNTSPSGEPFMCPECEKVNEGRDWRREAEENGETWEPEEY